MECREHVCCIPSTIRNNSLTTRVMRCKLSDVVNLLKQERIPIIGSAPMFDR